ncbi:MAG: bifunctional riboflavin kinase/FAD synthetase [Candidatus Aminicenantes bacterium]|nr:bifunctional riboflavin kinase/FAD synthetase [Candidatus Aminicenantes bacterium]
MNIIRGLEDTAALPKKTAVAIGNFDGVHLGHQKILETLIFESEKYGLVSVALTFSPHPKKVVGKDPIKMIQSLGQRLKIIEQFHVHTVLILPFNKELANHTAEDFIQNLVLDPMKAEEVIVGKNFCFGRNRSGCSKTLCDLGEKNDFRVLIIPPVTVGGTTVSSSLIRRLLCEGNLEKANSLLGRPYEIEGTVIEGKRRGKSLGFPTANIRTDNEIIPRGVFLSRTIVEGRDFPSMTNVGKCPTFDQSTTNVESYLLNFDSDIYGKIIQVRFLKKIRTEQKFDSTQDLSRQIKKDLRLANEFFNLS